MKVRELAERLGCELFGDGEVEVKGVAPLDQAQEGDLSFVVHKRYLSHLHSSQASAFILPADAPPCEKPTLRTSNPYLLLARALTLLVPPVKKEAGLHPTAVIVEGVRLERGVSIGPLAVLEEGVVVGEGTTIGPLVYIGNGSRIGRDCFIYPQVTIREGVTLGDRVIVHSGAVIGSDGFGYAKDEKGRLVKIPQVGRVLIGDDVEIGANVTIDRGTLGQTWVKRGTKIDNLVQIAHNVVIGEDCILVAQVGISGSTILEDRVTLAGQVGVVDHVRIGHDTIVGAQAGVTKEIPPRSVFVGAPAMPHLEFKRTLAALNRLPELLKSFRALEERVKQLEEKL